MQRCVNPRRAAFNSPRLTAKNCLTTQVPVLQTEMNAIPAVVLQEYRLRPYNHSTDRQHVMDICVDVCEFCEIVDTPSLHVNHMWLHYMSALNNTTSCGCFYTYKSWPQDVTATSKNKGKLLFAKKFVSCIGMCTCHTSMRSGYDALQVVLKAVL